MAGRNSEKGKHRKPAQYKREKTSFQQRYDIVQYLDTHTPEKPISHFYSHLTRSKKRSFHRWCGERNRIELYATQAATAAQYRGRSDGAATSLSPEMEVEIVTWINLLLKDGIPVSALMLRVKANEVARANGVEGFSASWSWRRGFMRRHKMSIRARTRQGQVTGANAEAMKVEFAARVLHSVITNKVERVYNADQTAVCFEYIPKRTISSRGEKTVWVRCAGKDKERMTAMIMADSDGNKCAPFVVLKAQKSTIPARQEENDRRRTGFGNRAWKAVFAAVGSTHVQVHDNPKGWWNEGLTLRFLEYHFGTRKADGVPVLLLWDDMSAHWTDAVLEYARSKAVLLEKVPPRYTFCCQPADDSWNKTLKDQLHQRWFTHLRADLATLQKVTAPNKADVMKWLHDPWNSLSARTVISGFRKCGLLTSELMSEDTSQDVGIATGTTADDSLVAALERINALDGTGASVVDDLTIASDNEDDAAAESDGEEVLAGRSDDDEAEEDAMAALPDDIWDAGGESSDSEDEGLIVVL